MGVQQPWELGPYPEALAARAPLAGAAREPLRPRGCALGAAQALQPLDGKLPAWLPACRTLGPEFNGKRPCIRINWLKEEN